MHRDPPASAFRVLGCASSSPHNLSSLKWSFPSSLCLYCIWTYRQGTYWLLWELTSPLTQMVEGEVYDGKKRNCLMTALSRNHWLAS